MSVYRSISLWGVWYLQRKSTPKNEYLRLKILVFLKTFMKTLKVKKLVWPWRLGIHLRNMKREDFCFRSFIFSFLSHRKHRTVKGGRGNTKEKFPCDAQLKILHLPIPSSEAIGNLIQFSHILQWQRRSSSGLWGICSDWGVRNSPVRIAYIVRNIIALRNLRVKFPTVAVLRASCPKISYPPNGHIIEGHLCLIMSGCSLGYK